MNKNNSSNNSHYTKVIIEKLYTSVSMFTNTSYGTWLRSRNDLEQVLMLQLWNHRFLQSDPIENARFVVHLNVVDFQGDARWSFEAGVGGLRTDNLIGLETLLAREDKKECPRSRRSLNASFVVAHTLKRRSKHGELCGLARLVSRIEMQQKGSRK